MLSLPGSVALVVGASQGIGASTMRALGQLGCRVFGASRSISPGPGRDGFGLTMDVTDEGSVASAIEAVIAQAGQLDLVVNCAGFALAGPIEDASLAEVHAQLDTNLFGVVRVCRAALPHLRRSGGIIVNIGSLASVVSLPYQAYYSASKAALAAFSEALRLEVARSGVRVVLIEPGDIKTTFTQNRRRTAQLTERYLESYRRVLEVVERDEQGALAAERVAEVVARAVRAGGSRPRYRVGLWSQRAAVGLAAVLPHGLFQWLLRKYYRV